MIRNDVAGFCEPEGRELGEDLPFIRNPRAEDVTNAEIRSVATMSSTLDLRRTHNVPDFALIVACESVERCLKDWWRR